MRAKLSSIEPKKLIYLYFIFTFVNTVLHLADFSFGFLGIIGDSFLYIAKIVICLAISIVVTNPKNEKFKALDPIVRKMVICELLEIAVSVYTTNVWSLAGVALLIIFIAKIILDYLFFLSLLGPGLRRTLWTLADFGAIAAAVMMVILSRELLLSAYGVLFLRFLYAGSFIKPCDCAYEMIGKKEPLPAKTKKIYFSIAAVVMLALFILTHVRTAADKANQGENGASDNYHAENIMPQWTGFHREWFGIIDPETGETTKAKYPHELDFDDAGIAWDYCGHFIDGHGKTVLSVSPFINEKKSARSRVLIEYLMKAFEDDAPDNINWDKDYTDFEQCGYKYFQNGVAVFYSEKCGGYGVINDKGKVIARPSFCDYSLKANYEIIPVYLKFTRHLNVINNQGKYLFDKFADLERVAYDDRCKLIIAHESFNGPYTLYDYSGNRLNPDSYYYGYETGRGDIFCMLKIYMDEGDRETAAAVDSTGAEIFESELYTDYYAYASKDGVINKMLAKRKDDEKWILIDMDGNRISDKTYSSVKYDRDYDNATAAKCVIDGSEEVERVSFE